MNFLLQVDMKQQFYHSGKYGIKVLTVTAPAASTKLIHEVINISITTTHLAYSNYIYGAVHAYFIYAQIIQMTKRINNH